MIASVSVEGCFHVARTSCYWFPATIAQTWSRDRPNSPCRNKPPDICFKRPFKCIVAVHQLSALVLRLRGKISWPPLERGKYDAHMPYSATPQAVNSAGRTPRSTGWVPQASQIGIYRARSRPVSPCLGLSLDVLVFFLFLRKHQLEI